MEIRSCDRCLKHLATLDRSKYNKDYESKYCKVKINDFMRYTNCEDEYIYCNDCGIKVRHFLNERVNNES